MSDFPENTTGDVQAWGLGHAQAAYHHYRIASYYARRARKFADKSIRLSWIVAGLVAVAIALLAVSFLLSQVGAS